MVSDGDYGWIVMEKRKRENFYASWATYQEETVSKEKKYKYLHRNDLVFDGGMKSSPSNTRIFFSRSCPISTAIESI